MKYRLDNLLATLSVRDLDFKEFVDRASKIDEITKVFDVDNIYAWQMLGLDVEVFAGKISLKTRLRDIKDQEFCVVDIESTGGIKAGEIIEIGAIKMKNFEKIDEFSSFVYAPEVPEVISELTGITAVDLIGAPNIVEVMERFRVFLGRAIFVAHNVNFDYGFISKAMGECGFGMLLNRKLCTIELARRTIASPRYGLGVLKELFSIQNEHHRALNDAISANEILKISLSKLPANVKYSEELIHFSKTAAMINKILKQENQQESLSLE